MLLAFYSVREFANWKAGETIFVSTAAGAVGRYVPLFIALDGLPNASYAVALLPSSPSRLVYE